MNSENILGYPVTTSDQNDCINQVFTWIRSEEKGKYIVCINPHSLQEAKSDPVFRNAIICADLVTPDGMGILIGSKILNGCIRDRVTGSDIFWGISRILNQEKGYRYFFLGSTDENLSRIREKMEVEFPNIEIAGMFAPSFKPKFSPEENKEIIDTINRARADVLWVGMTAPKQEKWVYQHKHLLNVKFIGPIGAVFAFLGGTVKRAHPWMQDHGFEWLPRLIREPKRLWKRTFISAPSFLVNVVHQRLKDNYNQRDYDHQDICSSPPQHHLSDIRTNLPINLKQ